MNYQDLKVYERYRYSLGSMYLRDSRGIARPLVRNKVPPWDLAVVLRYLSGAPFEPRKALHKALFLLALASGKRRGELHALARAKP